MHPKIVTAEQSSCHVPLLELLVLYRVFLPTYNFTSYVCMNSLLRQAKNIHEIHYLRQSYLDTGRSTAGLSQCCIRVFLISVIWLDPYGQMQLMNISNLKHRKDMGGTRRLFFGMQLLAMMYRVDQHVRRVLAQLSSPAKI